VTSRVQADRLQASIAEHAGFPLKVVVAMRYGEPSISAAIRELVEWGADRMLLFPMYPQYAAATTGSSYDELFRELPNRRFVPALRVVPPYYDHPAYLDALAQRFRDGLLEAGRSPEKIVVSFHGIPQRQVDAGDPYPRHCEATVQALAKRLGWGAGDYILCYQSRFGREPWLQPYTDETLQRLGSAGVRHILAICPGFTTDCLETIDEIGEIGLSQFRAAGGDSLTLIPCLNDSPAWIAAMRQIVVQELQGWF
jgi:ferrochelatase